MKTYINIIVWFSFMVVLFLFMGIFIYQTGDEFVLTPLDNVTQNLTSELGVSQDMRDHINDLPVQYRALPEPYDLGFIISFLIIFMASIISSIKSKEESWLSFFGTITIGFMVFLFMTGFFITLSDWFVLNLIQNFLEFDLSTTPIFLYYINNIGIINTVWFILLVIINKLNFTLIRGDDKNNINIPGGNV